MNAAFRDVQDQLDERAFEVDPDPVFYEPPERPDREEYARTSWPSRSSRPVDHGEPPW